jgi:hypothetical protein
VPGCLTAPVELRDGTVWDGATPIAAIEPSATATTADGGGTVVLRWLAPVVVGRENARGLVDALTASGAPSVDVCDPLIRFEARAAGWTGGLRRPLHRPGPTRSRAAGADPRVTAIGDLLPGVTVDRHGFGRSVLAVRARRADGLRLKVKVPDRLDLVPELVAAAIDTSFGVRRRFGRMASGVHTITIDDGAGAYDDHRTAGSAQSGTGTFFLDTSLAFADALAAQRRRAADRGGRSVSAEVSRPFTPIDGVVAHEYWHNLDTTVAATPAVYVEMNRALGEELGVETFEHALRGGESGAPPSWQAARLRIAEEVSLYALTNMREATAEMFKLWWCSTDDAPPSGLVARFGALLDRFFPPV